MFLNTQNRFVYSVLGINLSFNRIQFLNKIRRFIPNLGITRYIASNFAFVDLVYRNVYEAVHSTNYILTNL